MKNLFLKITRPLLLAVGVVAIPVVFEAGTQPAGPTTRPAGPTIKLAGACGQGIGECRRDYNAMCVIGDRPYATWACSRGCAPLA